jgi:DNA-binding transcriptional regulator YiaG
MWRFPEMKKLVKTEEVMTAQQLLHWRLETNLTQHQAARAFGVALNTYQVWERGFNFKNNDPSPPLTRRIRLACIAIKNKLGPAAFDDPLPNSSKKWNGSRAPDLHVMTKEALKQWRTKLRLTQKEAAVLLSCSLARLVQWECGETYSKLPESSAAKTEGKRPAIIPRTVALACAAIEAGHDDFELFIRMPFKQIATEQNKA